MAEINSIDKTRQDKTRQDKTRQDKRPPCVQDCQVVVLGQMDNTLDHTFESANRVYDKNQLCPTIPTCGGGGIQPKVIEEKICVAMRGRNPEKPTDRTAGLPTKQRLEIAPKGVDNTLTTVQKDNLVLEENAFFKQALKTAEEGNAEPGDIIDAFNKKVIKSGISPTITTRPEGKKTAILPCVQYKTVYRIRKLTPRECWRLMGYTDTDFDKANEVNSASQLYKQAGNAIVKQVLMAIFAQMIPESARKL